ncbi:MAG TPA: hypothetical protein VGM04_01725 [Sphingomicrobium sp.]
MILALGIVAPAAAALAASPPTALAKVAAGMWEISGVPGTKAPLRQCVANVLALAQFEHRSKACKANVIGNGERTTRIAYDCGSSGFGQSEVDVITPRSLKIATQGISDQQPFNYTLQAHRVGECEKSPSTPSH